MFTCILLLSPQARSLSLKRGPSASGEGHSDAAAANGSEEDGGDLRGEEKAKK